MMGCVDVLPRKKESHSLFSPFMTWPFASICLARALACQQPFNILPRLPTDAEQDLGPNFQVAVFHREEIARLIHISVKPCPAGNRQGEQRPDAGLNPSLLLE